MCSPPARPSARAAPATSAVSIAPACSLNPNDAWVNYTGDATTATTPIIEERAELETRTTRTLGPMPSVDALSSVAHLNLGARIDRFTSKDHLALAANMPGEPRWSYHRHALQLAGGPGLSSRRRTPNTLCELHF